MQKYILVVSSERLCYLDLEYMASKPVVIGDYVVNLGDIRTAREMIRPFGVNETPLLTSTTFDSLSGHCLYFK